MGFTVELIPNYLLEGLFMSEKILIIADAITNLGFQLAGVQTLSEINSISIEKALENLINKSEFGLIVIEDQLYSKVADSLKNKLEMLNKPIILSIPLNEAFKYETKSQSATRYVEEVITQSSGIHIRLT